MKPTVRKRPVFMCYVNKYTKDHYPLQHKNLRQLNPSTCSQAVLLFWQTQQSPSVILLAESRTVAVDLSYQEAICIFHFGAAIREVVEEEYKIAQPFLATCYGDGDSNRRSYARSSDDWRECFSIRAIAPEARTDRSGPSQNASLAVWP